MIIVDGIEREINKKELKDLSRKYLPHGMEAKYKDQFVDEVVWRISDLECDSSYTNGKSIEEYYFAACLAYAVDNGFIKFFDEEDDTNIFEYCGSEL